MKLRVDVGTRRPNAMASYCTRDSTNPVRCAVSQTSVGFLIGHAFSLRLAATGSLTEVIVLHMVNNICASFVPSDGSVNLLEPSNFPGSAITFSRDAATLQTPDKL